MAFDEYNMLDSNTDPFEGAFLAVLHGHLETMSILCTSHPESSHNDFKLSRKFDGKRPVI